MRRRFSRGKFRKRSTSWVAGITTYDLAAGTSSRLIPLAAIPGFAGLWGVSIGIVLPADLPPHGGEDAVLTRVVGRLGFMEGRKNAGAGVAAYGFQMRVAIVQTEVIPLGGGFAPSPYDYTSSVGMGNDNIIWEHDTIVPLQAIGATGNGYDLLAGGYERWLEVDTSAKRKVTEDRAIILWMQTVLPGGTTAADFRMIGGLRTLLMRAA